MEGNRNILLISLQEDLTILGLKILHYCLLENKYNSHFLVLPEFDVRNNYALEKLKEFVLRVDPIFIGISLVSVEYKRASDLSSYLRNEFPGLPILWGGVHPTVAPETCFPFADYVCIGEGVRVIVDFAEAMSRGEDPREINNLCYIENGTLKKNPLNPLIENLDEISYGDHIPKSGFVQDGEGIIRQMDRRVFKKYGRYQDRFYDIFTTLGCHLSCTYCSSPFFSRLYGGHRVRKRGLEGIINELERAVRDYPFIEMVNFQDENFLVYNLEFMKRFRDEYRARVRRPFMFACTPMWVTREKISVLKDAGLIWVRMGLQSGSDRVLREIYRRKSMSRHFLRAMEIFKEFRVAVYGDAILDNPLETDEDLLETAKVIIQAKRPFYLQIYSLIPFYGTEIYEMIKKQCPEKLANPGGDLFSYKKTSLNDLIRISAYVPRFIMNILVRFYEENPMGVRFRYLLAFAKFICVLFFEPVTFFRVFRLSQGGSTIKVLKMIPIYKRIWLQRYSKHFKKR